MSDSLRSITLQFIAEPIASQSITTAIVFMAQRM